MTKERLLAYSDGVIAIIITIMVLELKPPHGARFADLQPLAPAFLSYLLSFVNVGIYWNNHHHMFHAVHRVNGRVLWANQVLLFCLSLTPFVTAWAGENHYEPVPVAAWGVVLLASALSYTFLARQIICLDGVDSTLGRAFGRDTKGKLSIAIYAASTLLAFVNPAVALAGYVLVALIWFVPDTRVERAVRAEPA